MTEHTPMRIEDASAEIVHSAAALRGLLELTIAHSSSSVLEKDDFAAIVRAIVERVGMSLEVANLALGEGPAGYFPMAEVRHGQ